ncbi:MAG: hypothetical protein ACI4PO_03885 [Faecousia sp.]
MKTILITGAGYGKSSQELEKYIAMAMEAEESRQEIRRCGQSWVCCNGACDRCLIPRMTTTNRTEPSNTQTYSNKSKED